MVPVSPRRAALINGWAPHETPDRQRTRQQVISNTLPFLVGDYDLPCKASDFSGGYVPTAQQIQEHRALGRSTHSRNLRFTVNDATSELEAHTWSIDL
jgi:hypothetical protein